MKKAAVIILSGIMTLSHLSCKKEKEAINEATEFNIDYSSEVSVPSTSISVTAPAEFNSPEIPTTSQNRFAQEKTTQSLIEEIKMTKFNLSNPNGNLDFLKSITVYIKAANLGDIEVASKSNIPPGTTSIGADLSMANIKEHIFKDKIQFRVKVTISTGLTSDQKLKIDQTVRVKGKRV